LAAAIPSRALPGIPGADMAERALSSVANRVWCVWWWCRKRAHDVWGVARGRGRNVWARGKSDGCDTHTAVLCCGVLGAGLCWTRTASVMAEEESGASGASVASVHPSWLGARRQAVPVRVSGCHRQISVLTAVVPSTVVNGPRQSPVLSTPPGASSWLSITLVHASPIHQASSPYTIFPSLQRLAFPPHRVAPSLQMQQLQQDTLQDCHIACT
jgi:hypothetical protein